MLLFDVFNRIDPFDDVDVAKQAYLNKKKEFEKEKEQLRLTEPIKRNEDGIPIIELFDKNKQKVGETTINDYRYYDTTKHKWCSNGYGYVQGSINGKRTLLHRFLMNAKPGDIVDHINNNTYDNRLENLRFSTHALNAHSRSKNKNTTSKYFGVSFYKKDNIFVATITKDKKTYYLGRFKDEIAASKVVDEKAIELYGDKAKLNWKNKNGRIESPQI